MPRTLTIPLELKRWANRQRSINVCRKCGKKTNKLAPLCTKKGCGGRILPMVVRSIWMSYQQGGCRWLDKTLGEGWNPWAQ